MSVPSDSSTLPGQVSNSKYIVAKWLQLSNERVLAATLCLQESDPVHPKK